MSPLRLLRTLDRKLVRELWEMKGQAAAIGMVIASGVATLLMSLSTLDSLRTTQQLYYRDQRFADVFASLERGPERLAESIAEIPGVQQLETRVVAGVNVDIEGFDDPVKARLVSLPGNGEAVLNQLFLREGRTVDPMRDDEAVLVEATAEAHGLEPGDRITAIINGRRKELRIVGIALAPEYIYQIAPGGLFPDYERFAILWMAHEPLAAAYDMEGAFNDVALTVTPGASVDDVILRLDDLLERYGGLGAYSRADQVSHRYLSEEFRQLETMARIFPVIFLSVAAFLLNVVVTRLIRTQREEIATLKAFGYRNRDVVVHFVKLIVVIVLIGTAGGVALGIFLGRGLSTMYATFYKFPFLRYELDPRFVLLGAAVSLAAAVAGTLYSVWAAARQPPAEAMRPEPPARYRETLVERLGLRRWLAQPTRMILRNIERRPVKALLSIVGIAASCAILMIGLVFNDSIDSMIEVQFGFAQRADLTVTFNEPTSWGALFELASLDGVRAVEPRRSVPVRLRHGHRDYRTEIRGLESGTDLVRVIDTSLELVELPPAGIVLTRYLGEELLGVGPGDLLTVEVLEGARTTHRVPVAALVGEYIGVTGYMRIDALNRMVSEGRALSGAYMDIDRAAESAIYERLDETPRVAGVTVQRNALAAFYDTIADTMLTFAFFNTLLAASIALGVVYNSARIALSERGRELASLRVLGFRRAEVSYILLGELALLTLIAIPVGFVLGNGLTLLMFRNLQTDLFRFPLTVSVRTYSLAAATILASALISGLIVRRRIDRLDLVAVLKTRE